MCDSIPTNNKTPKKKNSASNSTALIYSRSSSSSFFFLTITTHPTRSITESPKRNESVAGIWKNTWPSITPRIVNKNIAPIIISIFENSEFCLGISRFPLTYL